MLKRAHRNHSHIHVFIAAAAVFLALTACKRNKKGEEPERPAKTEPSSSSSGDESAQNEKKRTLRMSELHPSIAEQAEEGAMPSAIAVEFTEPLVQRAGEAVDDKTSVKIVPEVRGKLEWRTPSTLVFIPKESLRPDTKYTVTLEAVATREGVLKAEREGAYERTFTTPKFKHLRSSFAAFDPKRNRLEVEIVFSAPVDVGTIKENAGWTVNGLPITKVSYERTDRKNVARATLFDKRIDFGTTVEYAQDQGVRCLLDKSIKAPPSSDKIRLNDGKPIDIFSAHPEEGTSGFYLAVVCSDAASGPAQQYFWDEKTGQSWQVSPRCVLEESDAKDSVHINPPVPFSITPTRGGFRILGDFKRGSYSVRIDANARSMDGGVLKKPYEASFSVPARKPQLSFVSQGRYLPTNAWKNLAIRHMNVSEATVVVRNIPLSNLVFWLSGNQETADARNSNVLITRTIPLRGDPDVLTTSYIDASALLSKPVGGVLELALTAEGAQAKSRIMLTDINLVAKQSASTGKVNVWALAMHTDAPIGGVEIKQVAMSGRMISSCVTDRDGACTLEGKSADDPDPSDPFALIASHDGDVTYIRYSDLKIEIADVAVQGRAFETEEQPSQPVEEMEGEEGEDAPVQRAKARPSKKNEPSAYRAAIYSDRGVYRPGETAHVVAIIRGRDDLAPPEGMPVNLELLDPKKKVSKKLLRKTNAAGIVTADLKFDDYADTGSWSVTLEAGKKSFGRYAFNVEEFVPERMKVTAKTPKADYEINSKIPVEVTAQYLFGGSAGGSRVEMSCELKPATFSPKTNGNFEYGIWREDAKHGAQPLSIGTASGEIGDNNTGTLTCPSLTQRGGFTGTARLSAKVAVFEAGSGRTTQGEAVAMIHPETFYVGLASSTRKVKAGEAFNVDGVVVDWTGALSKQAGEVRLQLYRVQEDYDWVYDEQGRWNYRHYTRLAAEGPEQIAKVKDGKLQLSLTAPADAQGFVVRAHAGRAQTDLWIDGSGSSWWWWWGGANGRDETPRPQKPAAVPMDAPASTKVGLKTKVAFDSPFKGRALMTLETDKVISSEWMEAVAGKNEWTFTLKEFVPNVYVSVLVAKDPHLDSKASFLPSRGFGVQSVRVEPEAFEHNIKMDVPAEIRSNSKLEVKLDLGKLDEPTFVTVAAVDEGILSLTHFASPDPLASIFDPRALGIYTYETIGWNLLLPAAGSSRSEGGDEGGGSAGRVQPVKPVALWSGLVEVPASGKAVVTLDVPQYRGSLRVMAVTAGKKRLGKASANVLVRDPLVLQTTLPRFLTYGDNAEVPVFVTNLSGKPQSIEVSLTAEVLPVPGLVDKQPLASSDVIQIKGAAKKKLELAHEKHGTVVFRVKALQAIGAAKLRVKVTAGELSSSEDLDVPFLPAAPKTREVQKVELSEGRTDLKKYLGGWMPTTERTTVWVTSNPYGESFQHLSYLLHYPYGCIEQTSSGTRALLYAGNLLGNVDPMLVAKDRVEDMVMSGINRILSMQTPSGGFAYWPGSQETIPWGTAYATHVLLDAQKLRYPVPEERIKDAVDWMGNELTNKFESGTPDRNFDWYYGRNAEAYMHFVMAQAGHGRKARIEKLIETAKTKKFDSEEDAEALYMLKAALYMAGDHRYESDLKNPDVSEITSVRRNGWSFYSDRRRRGMMLSIFSDLFGNDPAGEKLANLVAESLRNHPSYWYTTQEIVWGVTGLGKRIGAQSSFESAKLSGNGRELKAQLAGAGAKSSDKSWAVARASEYESLEVELTKPVGRVFAVISSEGVKTDAKYKVGGEGLSIKRSYVDGSGEPFNLSNGSMKLGDVVYATISVTNNTGEAIHNVALVDRFPAGWEIENPRLGRGATSFDWIDKEKLWSADYMNLRDDRIELFGLLNPHETREVVYALRAVTSGQFTMPPVEAEAMYFPDQWAREAGARVMITGPWNDYGD